MKQAHHSSFSPPESSDTKLTYTIVHSLAMGCCFCWLVLMMVHRIAPQRSGWLALTQIIAPYLAPLLLWCLPLMLRRGKRAWALRITLCVCGMLFFLRFPLRLRAIPATQSSDITVLHWNVQVTNPHGTRFFDYLYAQSADVVSLIECDWTALAQNTDLAQHYAYQLFYPTEGIPPGMALLSRYPIEDYGVVTEPAALWDIDRILWAKLRLDQAQLLVIMVHPRPPQYWGGACGVFCTTQRDAQIAAVMALAERFVVEGHPVLLAGDLNVTEREPAYADVAAVLHDAYVQVGQGWGHTWGYQGWFPLLRIDYLMHSADVVPLSFGEDCSAPDSDHCSLLGAFGINKEN